MSKTEKATREYLESLSKDQVINLCLQFMFDVEVTEQQLAIQELEKVTDYAWCKQMKFKIISTSKSKS